jgi:hypothetical protein
MLAYALNVDSTILTFIDPAILIDSRVFLFCKDYIIFLSIHADIITRETKPIQGRINPMRFLPLILASLALSGCQCSRYSSSPQTAPKAKWCAETGLGTSLYPNAPYDGHEYMVEKIDINIKLKREW